MVPATIALCCHDRVAQGLCIELAITDTELRLIANASIMDVTIHPVNGQRTFARSVWTSQTIAGDGHHRKKIDDDRQRKRQDISAFELIATRDGRQPTACSGNQGCEALVGRYVENRWEANARPKEAVSCGDALLLQYGQVLADMQTRKTF